VVVAGTRPRSQYEAIRRTQLRFRVLPVAYGLVVASTAIFFTLTGNVFSVFVLLPLAMMVWFYFIRPAHRRRYRRAIADLPRWNLSPE
jgi:Flp pilus assembly protein TadB